ncbi:MAG: PIG-L family deacetylase [Planctomycetota bacterium]|nr:PIG-L family deacetylase [Planctomycetota bacterium]
MSFKTPLRAARALAASGTQWIWEQGLCIAGCWTKPVVRRWDSPGAQQVLVIAPHPDDEALGCAGTLLAHRRAKDDIWVVHVTDGRRSRARRLDAAEMARQRKTEAENAAHLLGIQRFAWLGLPERDWSTEDLRSRLVTLLDVFSPSIIYAPSLVDFHPEHIRVAQAIALALLEHRQSPEFPPVIRAYPMQVPLTACLTNVITDVSCDQAAIKAVFDTYLTQRNSLLRGLRLRRYAACFYRVGSLVEEFWELSVEHYAALHRELRLLDRGGPFRGLRYHPFSDPLSYLQGRSLRRRLNRR